MSYVDREPLHCPKKGSSPEAFDKFLNAVIDPLSTKRIEFEDECLLAKAFTEGKQWLHKLKIAGSLRDYRRAPRIRESSRNEIPTPTDNVILEAVENEVARLAKRNSEVIVEPSDASPTAKAGAKMATDVLMDHLNEIRWERIRYRSIWRTVQYGTLILKSFLQQDNLDSVKVGVQGAVKCAGLPPSPEEAAINEALGMPAPTGVPPCGFKLASPELGHEHAAKLPPDQQLRLGSDDSLSVPGMPDEENEKRKKYTAESCLHCGQPLQPFTPADQELEEKDAVGRALSKDVPLGKAMIESVSPYDFYPENEGIGVEPETQREVAQSTPRSLDWVKQYFRKNVDQVKAEDPLEIAETHPIWGESSPQSKGATGAAERIYRNHVRVREYYKWPSVEYPRGRAIVMAGNVVLMDDDLMVDSPAVPGDENPKPFPRVRYSIARCFPKDGELLGQGFPVQAVSDQNRINMSLSQVVDNRERHGSAGILSTRGMKLSAQWLKSHAGRNLVWEPDPLAPNAEPKHFPTHLMDSAVWQEIEYATGRVFKRLGTNEVETGNAPSGLKAYSAIRYLGEKASERRQQREKEIIAAFEETFQHQLMLMQRYYREPRNYHVKLGDEREKREFLGIQLQGETRAKIKESPQYDVEAAEREALAENVQIFPELMGTPHSRRETAKKLGVPMTPFDGTNVQLDDANAKWLEFVREGVIPVVDETLDDHAVFHSEYGRLLKTSDGKERSKKVGWDQVLKKLSGWQQILNPPPIMGPLVPSPDPKQPPQPQMIPVPGPLPNAPLQDRILFVWGQMLGQTQDPMAPPPPPLDPELQKYMAFRAAYEAHKMLAEAAMGPMPAPGGGAPLPMGAPAAPSLPPLPA
jgi:hypothetical protein